MAPPWRCHIHTYSETLPCQREEKQGVRCMGRACDAWRERGVCVANPPKKGHVCGGSRLRALGRTHTRRERRDARDGGGDGVGLRRIGRRRWRRRRASLDGGGRRRDRRRDRRRRKRARLSRAVFTLRFETASLSVGLCGELLELSAQLLLLSEALVELLPQRLIAQPLLHRAHAPADARRETGKLVLHRKDLGDIRGRVWGV